MTMYSTAEARLGVFLIEIFALYDRLHPHKRFTGLEVWFLVSTLTLIRQNNDCVVFVIREGRVELWIQSSLCSSFSTAKPKYKICNFEEKKTYFVVKCYWRTSCKILL